MKRQTKNKHYSKVLVLAPDKTPLNGTSKRKADWYVKRNLAEDIDTEPYEGFDRVIRLTFMPKKITAGTKFHTQVLHDQCVCCGKEQDLTLHHVVPASIRKYFPDKHKTHQHGWCVLLCNDHHDEAEHLARELYSSYFDKINKMTRNTTHAINHKTLRRLRSLKHNKVTQKIDEQFVIRSIQQVSTIEKARKISTATLNELIEEECIKAKEAEREIKRKYKEEYIKQNGGPEQVKQMFKQAFLELEPKCLPHGFLQDHD